MGTSGRLWPGVRRGARERGSSGACPPVARATLWPRATRPLTAAQPSRRAGDRIPDPLRAGAATSEPCIWRNGCREAQIFSPPAVFRSVNRIQANSGCCVVGAGLVQASLRRGGTRKVTRRAAGEWRDAVRAQHAARSRGGAQVRSGCSASLQLQRRTGQLQRRGGLAAMPGARGAGRTARLLPSPGSKLMRHGPCNIHFCFDQKHHTSSNVLCSPSPRQPRPTRLPWIRRAPPLPRGASKAYETTS
jgi:hypothetical protein